MIRELKTEAELLAAFPIIRQLRTTLCEGEFLKRYTEQFETQNYHIAALFSGGKPVAVAGYRFSCSLASGKTVYIDDLVADAASRGTGAGGKLLRWVERQAGQFGCSEVHLDSGVQRHAAHRFYLRERFDIVFHHFAKKL